MKNERPIFVLRLTPLPGVNPIRALRHVLKRLVARRRGGFEVRCCECNSRKGRLSESVAGFLQDTWRVFGPPRAAIHLTRDQKGTVIMNREDVFPSRYFKAANFPSHATSRSLLRKWRK
jgi:hypothetical protein